MCIVLKVYRNILKKSFDFNHYWLPTLIKYNKKYINKLYDKFIEIIYLTL